MRKVVAISLREMGPYGLDGPLEGSRPGPASRYAIGSPARLSSELGRAAFQAMTLRKPMYHRLAVAGTATRAFLPADVPSAAKRHVAFFL